MLRWWNWYTCTIEVRVPYGLWVRVPSWAITLLQVSLPVFFIIWLSRNLIYSPQLISMPWGVPRRTTGSWAITLLQVSLPVFFIISLYDNFTIVYSSNTNIYHLSFPIYHCFLLSYNHFRWFNNSLISIFFIHKSSFKFLDNFSF